MFNSVFEDNVCAGVRVGNSDFHGLEVAGSKLESHLTWRGASHLDGVVFVGFNLNWEAGKAQLAGVEAIPDVVHHGVDDVVVAIVVRDRDRLDTSVIRVAVERLEQKNAEVRVLAEVRVPGCLEVADTCVICGASEACENRVSLETGDGTGDIGSNLETVCRDASSSVELEDGVVWRSAREFTTVIDHSPALGRRFDVDERIELDSYENRRSENVARNVI